ncbi:GAF domain-containing protein [Pseudodesulfovibrio tunisiensis]|uniref:GAF domain-containing protein n=1 Tax=Pseudodesulfovibrio tunisiensis TaxID=463192 RepID=UPI001FB4BE04|nr:GAF domain-containing protein [Pseudodesulfovibrio tunisiensis]
MLHRGGRSDARRIFLVEALLGLGIITVVNMLFYRANPGFIDVAPHPYWLVVVPIAVRYGFTGGLMAGLISGLAYFGFKIISIPDVSIVEATSFDVWGKPLLLISVGAILGEIRQLQISELNELRTERDELRSTCDRQREQYEALSKAKEEVDTRIVSQEHTLATLYEATQSLRTLNAEGIYSAILDLLQDYVHADESTIFIREDNTLVLRGAQVAPDRIVPETIPLDQAESMIVKAVTTGKPQSLNMELLDQGAPDSTLIAAPITTADDKHVMGVVVVEKMPFVKFSPTAIQMTALIADWCGASLENALLYNETRDKLIADEVIDAYRFEYLNRRLDEEFNRARRYDLDLSLIILDLPGLEELEADDLQSVLAEMSVVLKSSIRNIDLLFLNNRPGSFVLLLPTTSMEGARVVVRNLNRAFQALPASGRMGALRSLRAGLSAYRTGMEKPGELYEDATRKTSYVRFEN